MGNFADKQFDLFYEGSFHNGKHDGFGREIHSSGETFIGYYKNNRYHGLGIKAQFRFDEKGVLQKEIQFEGIWENGAFTKPYKI